MQLSHLIFIILRCEGTLEGLEQTKTISLEFVSNPRFSPLLTQAISKTYIAPVS